MMIKKNKIMKEIRNKMKETNAKEDSVKMRESLDGLRLLLLAEEAV